MTTGAAPDLAPPRPSAGVGDVAVRVAGAVISLAGGLLVAVLAVLAVPWRVDTWFGLMRMPLAVLFALAGTLALVWFAPRATGARWAVLLPAAGWFAVLLAAMRTTADGSYLLMPNDLVAVLTLVSGTIVMVAATVLALTGGRRPGLPVAATGASSGRGSASPERSETPPSRTGSL